ncbi:uncharacterized protein [Nicotiana sylvestris]|uniref:uncharacterized protein n=1 Tax=Nicotiana sylvestris TaxID=4096 RepID=UPI00388CD5CB
MAESYDGWRLLFNGAANFKGVGIGAILVSENSKHYPVSAKLRFPCTNNMAEYEAYILGLKMPIDMNVQELLVIGDSNLLIHQVRGEWTTQNSKILPYLHHIQELRKRLVVSLFGILETHPYNTSSKDKLIMANQELDASVIDPLREGEESNVNLKEEVH